MVAFVLGCSLAWGSKWDDVPADVEVSRVIDADPLTVHRRFDDWQEWQSLMPGDCAIEWRLNARTTGVGARATVRYDLGPMRRLLRGVITQDEPGRVLLVEHEGNRGWYTQFRVEAVPDGTRATLLTPLTAPPWPLKSIFHRSVKPAMEDCYARTLQAIADVTDDADEP
ncbi:MAG: SRPBCC family protein [Myxococcales bacterium]|nr:SRPBCC family protein [Myxococcales bacterium]